MKNFCENNKKNIICLFQDKYFYLLGIFLLLGIFFYGGFLAGKKFELKDSKNYDKSTQQNSREIRQAGYKFVNPLLECEVENTSPIFKSAEIKIKKTIQEDIIEENPSVSVSLYYRDLKNGPAFGINEQEKYSPASLLKVPLMITYHKYAEKNHEVFDREILFDKASSEFYKQEVAPANRLEVGKNYTVAALIEAMILYSDNEAANLLFQNINPDELNLIFSDLGLSVPNLYDPDNAITTKDYASFFRILYNSSYLSREMSERALGLLSMVNYREGLVAGIPKEIMISHKFGERESLGENKKIVRQLHDCGIIYHPARPYLLCVMTKGEKFEDLSKIISQISNIIYKEVDSK